MQGPCIGLGRGGWLPREDDNPRVIAGKLPGSHLADLHGPWRRTRERAGLEDGRLKRSVGKGGTLGERLDPSLIPRIYKAMAHPAELPG